MPVLRKQSLYGIGKKIFGAVGCPPIFTDEEKQAWINYVTAVVKHYKGRVNYFEVWNEPDGKWCWKHGVNAEELGKFTIATAKAVKEANSAAKTIGGVVCMRKLDFLNTALKTGMGEYLDYISFHEYTHDENQLSRHEITTGSFENAHGKAFAYWYPSNIMTTSYHSTITVELYTQYCDIKLVDIMDGSIYEKK